MSGSQRDSVREPERDSVLDSLRPPSRPPFSARRPLPSRSGTLRRYRAAFATVVIGLSATFFGTWLVRREEKADARDAFEQRTREVALAVERQFQGTTEALLALPALFQASDSVTRTEFSEFARPALGRHPSIAALEWVRRITAAERAAFESRLREESLPSYSVREPGPDGGMMPVRARTEYFPIVFMEPELEAILGLDVGFEPLRRSVIDRAVSTGGVVVSSRFNLVEDAPGVNSVAVYAPVFRGDGPRRLDGLAIGLFRIKPLVERAIHELKLGTLNFALVDLDAAEPQRVLFENIAGTYARVPNAELSSRYEFAFTDRHYAVLCAGHFERGAASLGIFSVGVVLTAAAASLLFIRGRMRRLEREVERAHRLGQYTLIKKLGEGGMGAVYEARHALLRRPTAIKLIAREEVTEEHLVRFEREVRYTSEMHHPNTIAIYDFGRTPEGVFYYAMEYIEGLTFEELVRNAGTLPARRVVHLMKQAAGAVAEAHNSGLLHRDLKPANLMLCQRGGISDFVKVLDFGLVKEMGTHVGEPTVSRADRFLGTPHYMAPETVNAPSSSGPAVDTYALGAIMYYLLTGTTLFKGNTLVHVITQTISLRPTPPSERTNNPVPKELEDLVLRCVAKNPSERPATAGDLLRELLICEQLIGRWSDEEASAWWTAQGVALVREARAGAENLPAATAFDHTLSVDWARRAAQSPRT